MSSSFLLPLLLIVLAVPLFLSARKQKRQAQSMQSMQKSLTPGDRVMTTSGMHATVVSQTEDTIDLEIAEGVVTTWLIAAIREKIDNEPANDEIQDDTEDQARDAEGHVEESGAEQPASGAELAPPLEQGKKSS